MSYIIYPYIGVNSIRFGMTKEEIHSELGKPETTFMRNSYDNTGETEEYKDFFVCYDEDERCEAIEFFELADIILNGKAIFTGTYDEICGLFDDIEEDNTGFTEYKYGIGVYAPDKDETVCYPESVIVFKKRYYGGQLPDHSIQGDCVSVNEEDFITTVIFSPAQGNKNVIFRNYGFYTCGFSYDGRYFVFAQDAGVTLLRKMS